MTAPKLTKVQREALERRIADLTNERDTMRDALRTIVRVYRPTEDPTTAYAIAAKALASLGHTLTDAGRAALKGGES